MPELQQREDQEQQLRNEFRTKHAKAVNLALYKQQLADIEKSFGAMLRQLPSKTEVPNLLVDISQTGLAAALQEKLFQPGQEVKKDFYAELPIKIQLTGSYHEFGAFVSGIAALPRIVTLHDIQITPLDKNIGGYDQLQLDLTAKTYRYLDDEEIAAAEAEKRKADQAKRPRNAEAMTHVDSAVDAPLARLAVRGAAGAALLAGCSGRDADLDRFIERPRRSPAAGSSRCRRSSPTRPSPIPTRTLRSPFVPGGSAARAPACGRTATAIASTSSSSRSTR